MPQDDVPQLRHEILLRLQCHSHRELHMLPGADTQGVGLVGWWILVGWVSLIEVMFLLFSCFSVF